VSILDAFRVDGKVALVTGAGRGLGQAIAVALAEAGADIVGMDRTPGREDTDNRVRVLGRRFAHITLDLDEASVPQLNEIVAHVVQDFGRLDILVNNAGIIRRSPALDFSEEDWDSTIQVNLKSLFFLAQAAAKVMKSQGSGKIINVASLLSYQGGILVPAYAAAKHGVMGLTKALSNEWAALGINVNAIAPGYMATDNTIALRADEARNAAILARIPVGRWGESDDLKGAALFLASSASDYVHGITIPVDGGWMAR
jgi:2-dehydro-3-deoxy-D-gluconate 5-dehydrogenase